MITPRPRLYVRNSDPETALKAAIKTTGDKTRANLSRQAVYAAFLDRAPRHLCDPQIALWVANSPYRECKYSPVRLRHARLELERAGVVERTGEHIEIDGTKYMGFCLKDKK